MKQKQLIKFYRNFDSNIVPDSLVFSRHKKNARLVTNA